ncbi:MAG: hypothetical protein ABI700_19900 [Chloroflexota bacterium]
MGFLPDKHNINHFTAARNGTGSFFDPGDMSGLRKDVYAYGQLVQQWNNRTGLLYYAPQYSAAMVPPGSTTATGYTHYIFVALANTSYEHPMGYAAETVWARFESGEMSGL